MGLATFTLPPFKDGIATVKFTFQRQKMAVTTAESNTQFSTDHRTPLITQMALLLKARKLPLRELYFCPKRNSTSIKKD